MNNLFIGFSGPVGYNYNKGDRAVRPEAPNAILEDVIGLLICYDNLYFLSRDFCPRDMWDLPYVKFLSDDSSYLDRAIIAYGQGVEIRNEFGRIGWGDISGKWAGIVNKMTGGDLSYIDNHAVGVKHVEGFPGANGNSADGDNILFDKLIAESLEIKNLDILTNTIAAEAAHKKIDPKLTENKFSDWHVGVTGALASLKVRNSLGVEGGYDERIEELRGDSHVKEFRKYIKQEVDENVDVQAKAKEISLHAQEIANEAFLKSRKKTPIYETVGKASIGLLGNMIVPGVGSLVSGSIKVRESYEKFLTKRNTAWASFVINLGRSS
ncbi:hypothetical protein GCM10010922_26070 [Microbacterium sorbitolivorans]|uniref:hypothetical protein n=1 Tax=Microbacterium sorbitolivorans TaxID=1867410 RepID=UPI0013B05DEC|nr:hypothetical protein [Microbacterium sorbitolivorans]GGF48971.1 hypothetical protein GCM10010922_26070 [Microbacterium sorbitolivorans]